MKLCKRLIALLLSIILTFLLTACDRSNNAYIYFELSDKPSTVDAQTATTDTELLIVKNIYEGLLRKNKDGKIDYGIAKSYTKKNLSYTFKLRQDAVWSNGDKVTADDFVFAFRRAVSFDTKAPFASRLFCISNAAEIYNGNANVDSLGVTAKDDYTLEITLNFDDKRFLETLTSSVAMPCNRRFFEESDGKYGLFKENVISNGSYNFSKWNKESFGIRLYKNKNYTGNFEAENAAVFLSSREDSTPYQTLLKNDADIVFIDSALKEQAVNDGFKTVESENICWVLTLSSDFPIGLRKSLAMLVGSEIYSSSLESGYYVATSLFPKLLSKEAIATGMVPYNLEGGKSLYSNEIAALEGKKFPSSVVLYYYNNEAIKPVVTDIVGHWQNNLGAFVNIEAVDQIELLTSQLKQQTHSMAIFPVRADSSDVSEYLKKFGVDYKGEDLSEVQALLLKGCNIIPLAFQESSVAYSKEISEISVDFSNGFIDFAFVVKQDKD